MNNRLEFYRATLPRLLTLILIMGLAFVAAAAALRAAPAGATPLERRLASTVYILTAADLNTEIDIANLMTTGTHTIVFLNDITLSSGSSPIDLNSGVTLIIDGNGFTLDGASTHRGFTILGGTVEIHNLRIAHGYSLSSGGGIWTNSGTLTVTNSIFFGNSTGFNGDGGGIWTNGTLLMSNSTLFGNFTGFNGDGGGIWTNSTMMLTDSTLFDNTGDLGGGLWTNSTLTVTDSTFYGNSSTYGSGIYAGDNFQLENVTISDNLSDAGAVYIASGTTPAETHIRNSTIYDNKATGSSASGLIAFSGLTIQNTIIAGNDNDECLNGSGTSIFSSGYNISGDNTCGFSGTGDQPNTDPLLGPLAANGGSTDTHALLPGSPALDAGNPAGCTTALGAPLSVDQRGWTRPIDGDLDGSATCDIGAYEKTIDLFLPVILR